MDDEPKVDQVGHDEDPTMADLGQCVEVNELRKANLAVKFLDNHTYPTGSATDLVSCHQWDGLIEPTLKVDLDDALSAAARYLRRMFDES